MSALSPTDPRGGDVSIEDARIEFNDLADDFANRMHLSFKANLAGVMAYLS